MKVTRDVIYDLLPGYFSGEVSADTRALVDQFLREDPEFSRMMERFQKVFRERLAVDQLSAVHQTHAFEETRARVQKRSELRGYVVAFSLATFFGLLLLWFAERTNQVRLLVIPGAFALTAIIAWIQLYNLRRRDGNAR